MRKLTLAEIQSILDDVVPLQNNHLFIQKDAVAKKMMLLNLRENLKEQLRYMEVVEGGIPLLKEMMREKIIKSLSQPGYMVGVTVAESFGQEVSQAALNSKRLTGAGNDIAGGLNAVKAVLNGSKGAIAPASIFFKDPYFTMFDVYRMAAHFTNVTLQNLTFRSTLLQHKDEEEKWWVPLHKKIYGEMNFTPNYIIRVYLNMEKVYNHQVSMEEILKGVMNINETNMFYPIASPLTEDEPFVDIYLNDDKLNDDVNKSAEIFYSTVFQIRDISIKGVPHLLRMTPAYVELKSCILKSVPVNVSNEDVDVREELTKKEKKKAKKMLENVHYLLLNEHLMNEYGIPKEKLVKLLESVGMENVPLLEREREEEEREGFLLVRMPKGVTEKPEVYLSNQILVKEDEQDKEFNRAVRERITSIPALNDVFRYSRHYFARVKMGKEKDKILKILAPLSCYKIIDISRSNSGDMYENLNTFGVVGLKNYLNQKIAALISGAGGTPVWMHVNMMTNYMTQLGNLTRFNLKGVEQGPGGMLAAIQWKDHMRLIGRNAAAGTEGNSGSLSLFKMFNGNLQAGSMISDVVEMPDDEMEAMLEQVKQAKTKKELEERMKEAEEAKEEKKERKPSGLKSEGLVASGLKKTTTVKKTVKKVKVIEEKKEEKEVNEKEKEEKKPRKKAVRKKKNVDLDEL